MEKRVQTKKEKGQKRGDELSGQDGWRQLGKKECWEETGWGGIPRLRS